jgi:DNA-binding NarL/FixJ family response regulator
MSVEFIRIGIVDDHSLVRQAVRNWLSQFSAFSIKIEAAGGNELFEKLHKDSELDVLILDLNMPGLNGKDCLIQLKEMFPHIRVIIVSVNLNHQMINELLDMGAYGYLSKDAEISELPEAIKAAFKRKVHRNKLLTESLYWRANDNDQHDSLPPDLSFSEKQKKILQLIWDEKSTQEIAGEVFLSVSAVDKIKQQLKEKTGAKTTLGLIKYAIANKIITIHSHQFFQK